MTGAQDRYYQMNYDGFRSLLVKPVSSKSLIGMSCLLLLGFVAFLSFSHRHPEDSGIALASAPSPISQTMQSARAWHSVLPSRPWQLPRARHFMQPMRATRNMQSESTLTSPDNPTYPVTNMEYRSEPAVSVRQVRRRMLAAALASAVATTAKDGKAVAEDTDKKDVDAEGLGKLFGAWAFAWGAFAAVGIPAKLIEEANKQKPQEVKNKRRR
eukprot:gnl/TRDRNA2_/TRDRNA2_31688_c0_seq1.p1 gnl/TRDRNA2_/TRDRNA2_31688_c0~~gnl/TRDRNA2_/TRDRNA2_31688_c0_seq1.p1  ORF type:complete len:213 (-),score=19.38 gnl/TRDRNA2_/TRDRNA2_31688_c0_seq1:198-836(-)